MIRRFFVGPKVFKFAIEQATAQGDDRVCATHGPEHAGLFEAAADYSFAASLNYAGADDRFQYDVAAASAGSIHSSTFCARDKK